MLTKGIYRFIICCLITAFLKTAASADVIPISPKEGDTVRETVRIAVAKSDVPEGGFVSFNVNGEFKGAIGTPKDIGKGRLAYVYDWDTKAVTTIHGAYGIPAEKLTVADGRHEIEVVVHDSSGVAKNRGKVSIRVANKIPVSNPPKPVRLAYNFAIGQQLNFDISAKVEVLDIEGRPIIDNSTILTSTSQVGLSIEDIVDSSALIRYRWQPVVQIQLMGQPYSNPVYVPAPAYRYVTAGGKVTEAGFGSKPSTPLFDILVALPGGMATIGKTWSASDHLTVPGVIKGARMDIRSTFDSLEWESGQECAKILMKLNSRFGLPLIPGQLEIPEGDISGTGVAYFAYKTGRLVSVEYVFESQSNVSSTVLDSLRKGQAGDIGNTMLPSATPTYPGVEAPDEPYGVPPMPGARRSSRYGGSDRPSAYRSSGPAYSQPQVDAETPVKFRIYVTVKHRK